jgi:hypothetical protein
VAAGSLPESNLSSFRHEARSPRVKSQVGKRAAAAPQFPGRAFRHIEKVAFGQQVLLAIYLQKTFPFQHNAGHIDLGIDVQRNPFSFVESQEVDIQVGAFQRKKRALGYRGIFDAKEIDDARIHLAPPQDSAFARAEV